MLSAYFRGVYDDWLKWRRKDEPLCRLRTFAAGSGTCSARFLLFCHPLVKLRVQQPSIMTKCWHLAYVICSEQLTWSISCARWFANIHSRGSARLCQWFTKAVHPVDKCARFETKNDEGHSFAHHLLIEQQVRYSVLCRSWFSLSFQSNLFLIHLKGEKLLSLFTKKHTCKLLAFPRNLFKDTISKSL